MTERLTTGIKTVLLSVGLTALIALTACGSEETPAPPDAESSASASEGSASQESGTVVDITIDDGDVTPKGKRYEVEVGETITLNITADVDGEIHVHSSPDQSVDFQAGTTTKTLSFDKPGVVDAELHDPELTVVQFEVR